MMSVREHRTTQLIKPAVITMKIIKILLLILSNSCILFSLFVCYLLLDSAHGLLDTLLGQCLNAVITEVVHAAVGERSRVVRQFHRTIDHIEPGYRHVEVWGMSLHGTLGWQTSGDNHHVVRLGRRLNHPGQTDWRTLPSMTLRHGSPVLTFQ